MTSTAAVPRHNVQGQATRTRLIAVAERLFAERGIGAVSLREIAARARQRNNATIQYHFGSKEGLLKAITVHHARATDQRRAAMLADLIAQPSGYDVVDLVDAMVRPLSVHLTPGDHYLAFLARLVEQRGWFPDIVEDIPGAMVMIPELLVRRLPDISEDLVRYRFDAAIVTMVHSLARAQRRLNRRDLAMPVTELVDDLIVVIAAGLATSRRAPAREEEPAS